MIFGHRVTKLREELSRTKQDLADMLGVSPATISKWENSKSSPNSTNLTLLAISLNTTTDYLQGLTDDPSSLRAKADTVVQAESTSPAKSLKLYSARQPTRTAQLTSQRLRPAHAVILR